MFSKPMLTKQKSGSATLFYLALLAAVAGVQLILKVFTTLVPDLPSQTCSRIMEGVLLVCTLFLALKTTFVQPWLGLRVEKAKAGRTVLTCLVLAGAVLALFVAARLVLQQFSATVAARPFFCLYLNVKHRRYYLFFVLLQEALAKGVLQHGVEKTLPQNKWYLALPVTALVFGMLHVYHTLYYMLGAIGLALLSGILYHRQKNVWASFVLHFMLAFLPRCFGLK